MSNHLWKKPCSVFVFFLCDVFGKRRGSELEDCEKVIHCILFGSILFVCLAVCVRRLCLLSISVDWSLCLGFSSLILTHLYFWSISGSLFEIFCCFVILSPLLFVLNPLSCSSLICSVQLIESFLFSYVMFVEILDCSCFSVQVLRVVGDENLLSTYYNFWKEFSQGASYLNLLYG